MEKQSRIGNRVIRNRIRTQPDRVVHVKPLVECPQATTTSHEYPKYAAAHVALHCIAESENGRQQEQQEVDGNAVCDHNEGRP